MAERNPALAGSVDDTMTEPDLTIDLTADAGPSPADPTTGVAVELPGDLSGDLGGDPGGWLLVRLAELAGVELAEVHLDDRLTEDLGLDSVDRFELLSLFDARGLDLPEELVVTLATVGDVAHYWTTIPDRGSRPLRSPLQGPNVSLHPVTPGDESWLFDLCTHPDNLVTYRLRGLTPSAEHFHQFLWDRALAQFVVRSRQGVPIGLASSFEPDFRNRYAYLAAVADPNLVGTGLIAEGVALLVTYLFAEFDLRKVYAESLSSNYDRYSSGARQLFDVESRMIDHEYVHGHYEDFLVLAAHREPWRDTHRRLFGSEPGY